ncbi:MAG: C69 family dipeptidase [Candidatus Aminicenantes bacterium]|jgi:secernin
MKTFIIKISIWVLLCLFLFVSGTELFPCDTWAALADATARGLTILAKNSDRLLFDCQPLMFYPRKSWPSGSVIDLGRISIPQAEETYATLGSSPYWCWGYEEGINEFGVAIGNEGVFSKELVENIAAAKKGQGPKPGPTGMDLLRLGLERGKTAREALDVITGLVEKYGQFGSGNPTMGVDGAYDNSYIIADPEEAWILETAGKRWIARKYTQGVASISNRLSIADKWDRASSDIVRFAVNKGWWPEEESEEFDFEKAYAADTPVEKARNYRARVRQKKSLGLLEEKKGEVTVRWMKRIARDRSSNPSIDLDQTASSCVAVLPQSAEDLPVFWWCASTPSSSCYVPFFVHGSRLPEMVSAAGTAGRTVIAPNQAQTDAFSEESYWWLFKDLRDKTNIDWAGRNPKVRKEFDTLEEEFAAGIPAVIKKAVELRQAGRIEEAARILDEYTAACVEKTLAKVSDLRMEFEKAGVPELYKPYIGVYLANFGPYKNAEFGVKVQNNSLAVDIPGQGVVELKNPDEGGFWYFKISNRVAVSFVEIDEGAVSALKFHETARFPRKKMDSAEQREKEVPKKYQQYVGMYTVPMQNLELTVLIKDGHLALEIPGQDVIDLEESDEKGRWVFSADAERAVSFARNRKGEISAMSLHSTFTLPKKKDKNEAITSSGGRECCS